MKNNNYPRYAKVRKYASGGNTQAGVGAAAAVGGQLGDALYTSGMQGAGANGLNQGDRNKMIGGSALSGAAAGAAAGMALGPWGAAAGGVIGAGFGLFKGITKANSVDEEAKKQKEQQEEYDRQLAEQKAEFERQQQDNYNKAYYSVNSLKGNTGVELYRNGGKLPKYPDGGKLVVTNPNDPRLKAYNDSLELYNMTKGIDEWLRTAKRDSKGAVSDDEFRKASQSNTYTPKFGKAYDDITKLNKGRTPDENLVRFKTKRADGTYGDNGYTSFAKPKITVIYKKPDLTKKPSEKKREVSFQPPLTNGPSRVIESEEIPESKPKESDNSGLTKQWEFGNGGYKFLIYKDNTGKEVKRETYTNDNKLVDPEKFPNGGTITASEWDRQNTSAGYMEYPRELSTQGGYKSYYNPNKFTPNVGSDGNIKWSKNGDPNYNFETGPEKPLISYTTPMYMRPGNTYMADTTKKYAKGGELQWLASDTVKAEGNTHAEGGIKLANGSGRPYAEVEDQEVIQGNNVFSDRITLPNSKNTIAMEAEKLAKVKGKHEKYLMSPNYREKNSAQRTTEFVDKKLDELFRYQEVSKLPVNSGNKYPDGGILPSMDEDVEGTSEYFRNYLNSKEPQYSSRSGGGFNAGQAVQMAIPYIDNIYNASLINKTPDIPIPTVKQAYYAKAMPLKTNVDVTASLASTNDDYRGFVSDLNQNTASSNTMRGNKLAAYAKTLQSKNSIYQNKFNAETQLINQNQQNIQNVENYNTKNAQDIANINLAQTDTYNMNKMYRNDDIIRRKSANVADAVNNATTQIQDYNMNKLDQEKIMLDSLQYSDGAGVSKMIGTPSFDKAVRSNDSYYKQAEKALIQSGQKKALDTFYKTYGKRR